MIINKINHCIYIPDSDEESYHTADEESYHTEDEESYHTEDEEIKSNKHQKQHIEKSFDDKKDLEKAVVNIAFSTATGAYWIKQEIIWNVLRDKFYPSLGATVELEKKAFLSALEEITKGLECDEKTKAVLINIQERAKAVDFTWGDDIVNGIKDQMATVDEIIADAGKNIDCEDFANMVIFWGETAIDKGYLPQGSEFVIIMGKRSFHSKTLHAVPFFISPDGDKYIIDINSFAIHDLYTLSEYQELDDRMDWIMPSTLMERFSADDIISKGITDYTYFPNRHYMYIEDDRISEEWLKQQSESPIDDSISAYDLRNKIYYKYGVSADHNLYRYDFPDNYKQYSTGGYWEERFSGFVKNPETISQDLSMAALEGSMSTVFAVHKCYKVNRRKRNIIKSHKVKEQWLEKKVNNTEMTLENFKDFGHISDIVDSSYNNKNLVHISNVFKSHKSLKTSQSFYRLIQDLKALFPEDEQLLDLEKTITEENLKKIRFIEKNLIKVLKKYGISIEYSTDGGIKSKIADKFRNIYNKKLNSCLCKTVIDKKKLYQTLKTKGLMLYDKDIKEIIEDRAKDIDVYFELRNYDNWKIKSITLDAKMKSASAIASIIPVLPIDEGIRAIAYNIESTYRNKNLYKMRYRIKNSQEFLEAHKNSLNSEDYDEIKNHLNNVLSLKNRRMKLKICKANKMVIIQTTTACAKIFTDPFGPFASIGRNIIKGSLKLANSIYPMVKRHIGDKEQRQSGNFHTVKDVYKLYKKVYLEAQKEGEKIIRRLDKINKENDCASISIAESDRKIGRERERERETERGSYMNRMKLIEDLAEKSFDLTRSQFQQLIKTLMVENDSFKLSFSRPCEGVQDSVSD